MAALAGFSSSDAIIIRYALPGDGLARLRHVADDADLWGLVSLLLYHEASNLRRIRVFLFADAAPALVEKKDETAVAAAASGGEGKHGGTAVRMKVSYGGEFIRRDRSAAAYYAGGFHHMVRVGLSERLAELRPRLAALAGCSDVSIRYALPASEEEGGELRDVASDGDLWTLVSLLFFHEAFTNSKPKRGRRIRVFLFAVDGASAPTTPALLRRSVSLPSSGGGKHRDASSLMPTLPTLMEEDEGDDDDDTVAVTGKTRKHKTKKFSSMRRSVSVPALATLSSGLDTASASTSSGGGNSASSSSEDDAPAAAAVQLGPVVFVPVMPAMVVYPVIPVYYAIRVVDSSVLLVA
uniref:Uncharacterized protein n=1 Tax=Leersia perrieri TaxID=77586 RepID=A0A0D9W359_9ORYZ